jgi:hypothetical protein
MYEAAIGLRSYLQPRPKILSNNIRAGRTAKTATRGLARCNPRECRFFGCVCPSTAKADFGISRFAKIGQKESLACSITVGRHSRPRRTRSASTT